MMRYRRSVAAVVCAAALSAGCIPEIDRPEPVVMDVLMLIVGATRRSAPVESAAARRQKHTGEITVQTTVTIGGLSGTYDVTLGPYGQFAGTAQVIGQKGAKLVDEGSPQLAAAVQGIVRDAVGYDVADLTATARVTGRQTTGGVRKRYKGQIKFTGAVASGADAGATVKGKIKTKGDLTD